MENVFKNKNFVLSFFGGLVSNIGAIFYSFAVSFYILDITGNNAEEILNREIENREK